MENHAGILYGKRNLTLEIKYIILIIFLKPYLVFSSNTMINAQRNGGWIQYNKNNNIVVL